MTTLTGLANWIGRASIGAVLVDQIVKATILLLAAWGLSRLLRQASAAARHQLWTAALVAILALPLLSQVLPTWRVPVLSAGVAETSTPLNGASSDLTPTPGLQTSVSLALAVPEEQQALPTSNAPIRSQWLVEAWLAEVRQLSASQVLPLVWALGALLCLARLLVSSIAAWRVVRNSTPVTDASLMAEVNMLCRQLGIRSRVTLIEHPKLAMPMAWGVFRQVVLLPSSAHGWTDERRRVVLLHELAHLKRWDCQILMLARVVAALHWFHPLAWIAVRRLQAEREHACDDLVLTAGTSGADYAQHLLDIARNMRSSLSPGWAMVAMARPSELEGRLLAILDPEVDRGQTNLRVRTAGVLAIALLVLPLAALQPRASAQEEASERLTGQVPASEGSQLAGLAPASVAPAGATPASAASSTSSRMIEVFAGALDDEDSEVRRQAAHALGSIEDAAAVPSLDKALRNDASEGVREQAAWAMGMIEHPSALTALKAAISDPSADVRQRAAWAMGMIESDVAVPELRKALTDEAAAVRQNAAWALGMIESDAAAESLGSALDKDEDAQVRERAAWAMGMIESPSTVRFLMSALEKDQSPAVREKAAWALGMIEDKTALDVLLDAMSDDSAEVRKQALWAVGQITG